MITIDDIRRRLSNTLESVADMEAEGYQAFLSDLRNIEVFRFAISQHEDIAKLNEASSVDVARINMLKDEIERLQTEAKEWKAFYFEALDKLNNAYERAAQVCDVLDLLQNSTFSGAADAIRELKDKP